MEAEINKRKQELINYAKELRESYIPAIREKTAELLTKLIFENQPKNILEIGTAVGVSGALMLLSCESGKLTTIDINAEMCKRAKDTFHKYNLKSRVNIVCEDALKFLENNNQVFDFVFLDGPKGQYLKYYKYFEKITKKGSVILCDDVLYFGMVLDDSKVIHKKITIVRNLREFISQCQNNILFETKLLDLEDGILILKRL